MKTPDFHNERVTMASQYFDPMQIIGGYVARYPAAYEFTLEFEGGYVNDPDDPGGCTNMGITIGTLRDWRNDPNVTCTDVKNLTESEAALIYATNYWAPVWGNKLPVGVNTEVWDFGVNAGPSRAIKILQECVNSPADGIMGPNTLDAVRNADIDALLVQYHDRRQSYYESLSTFDKYGNGWTRRNDDCLTLAQDLRGQRIVLPKSGLASRVARLEEWAGSFNKEPSNE